MLNIIEVLRIHGAREVKRDNSVLLTAQHDNFNSLLKEHV
jgi:hypothetical protein